MGVVVISHTKPRRERPVPIDGFEAERQELKGRIAVLEAFVEGNTHEGAKAAVAMLQQVCKHDREWDWERAELLRQLAEQGEKLKALERERDGLKATIRDMGWEKQAEALEQKIAGAKVCSHIYTRVALTSTTTCPACTNGIVWPEPAGNTPIPDEAAELRRKIAGARVCHSHKSIKPDDCDVCDEHGIVWPPKPAESKGVNE